MVLIQRLHLILRTVLDFTFAHQRELQIQNAATITESGIRDYKHVSNGQSVKTSATKNYLQPVIKESHQ